MCIRDRLVRAWSSRPGCHLIQLRPAFISKTACTVRTGSITCDTVPTGDTLWDDEAARFGLLRDATPGWSEFLPDQDAEEELGDIED